MRWHPALMMIATWSLCAFLLFTLPLRIVDRDITVYGYLMMFLSILIFCVGSLLKTPLLRQRHAPFVYQTDFTLADRVIMVVAIIAIFASTFDLFAGSGGDLAAAWQIRSSRTTAIIDGTDSGSSLAFQLGFLTHPIGYVAIAREIIFERRPRFARLLLVGFGPLLMVSLSLGGRGPLLFSLVMSGLSFATRQFVFRDARRQLARKMSAQGLFVVLVSSVIFFASLNYFVQVFIVRAGGADAIGDIFARTGDTWGVAFDGPTAEWMKSVLGLGNTYLIFVFSWYLVQGMVIGNVMFTSYHASPMLGVYGIELLLSFSRRFGGSFVSQHFVELDRINTFGFVSSAFGTLYVDYWFFGFAVTLGWGYLAGLVYSKSRTSFDGRWLLLVPFFIQGILFSLINTPFGLSNGLTSYIWLFVIFRIAKLDKSRFLIATRRPQPPVVVPTPLDQVGAVD